MMFVLFWFLLVLVGILLVLLVTALWARPIYERYAGARVVTCPDTGRHVGVRLDAVRAAFTGLSRSPELRLKDCTRWPERADCMQACLQQASPEEPRTKAEVEDFVTKRANRLQHLPIVAAAFAAWCLGVIWHSQYLFRAQWAQAMGLAGLAPRQVAKSWAPHLLSIAMCVLFAYGVAGLLAHFRKTGVGSGIVTSLLLCCAIAVASLAATGVGGISTELLKIEATYTVLASVVVGAIEGAFVKPAI